jgi:hypothetical protein
MIGKVAALRDDYMKSNKAQHAFVCQDALRELETSGRVTAATVTAAKKLGIPIAAGRAA